LDLLGNSEIERQPTRNQGSGKKIQVVEKKWERECQLLRSDA